MQGQLALHYFNLFSKENQKVRYYVNKNMNLCHFLFLQIFVFYFIS